MVTITFKKDKNKAIIYFENPMQAVREISHIIRDLKRARKKIIEMSLSGKFWEAELMFYDRVAFIFEESWKKRKQEKTS